MHRVLILAACLCLAASCEKKPSRDGLAPPTEWKGSQGAPAPEPANPHAGVAPSNPHAGMTSANPHAGMGGGAMPTGRAPETLEKTADGTSVLGPFGVTVPKDWTEKPVTSSMRAAQFELAGKAGTAELVVYYFGPRGAGGVDANIDRWLGQITQPDNRPSKDVAKIEQTKLAGQDATTISVTGRYTTTRMPGGPPPVDLSEAMLLGAIVASPKGPYYFKLTGPKATVEAHAAKFKAMLGSMKLR